MVIEMVHTVCVEVMNAFESDFGEMTDVLFCFHHFGCDFDGSLHECLVRYIVNSLVICRKCRITVTVERINFYQKLPKKKKKIEESDM